jgi:hypothetical protein
MAQLSDLDNRQIDHMDELDPLKLSCGMYACLIKCVTKGLPPDIPATLNWDFIDRNLLVKPAAKRALQRTRKPNASRVPARAGQVPVTADSVFRCLLQMGLNICI